jgi:FKBP-type peptidyl-prolyl cis-trans isomerase FklB
MQKLFAVMFQLFAAGIVLVGIAPAQTPAATPQPSQPASKSASTQGAPAKKTPASTVKKAPATTRSASALALKTQKEKESYALGLKVGSDLKRQGVSEAVDPAIAARGFKDAMAGSKPALTEDEESAALRQLQTEVMGKRQAKAQQEGAAARKEGDAFLAANKAKEGVVTLPSGLEYKILTEGTGPKPTANDTVTCNYRGTLLNGTEFDSSYKRGHPETFPVSGVIKGWTEALQLMPVGSKWQLFIPADMAYGDRGAGGDIGPGETLIFEVELLSIGDQKK